MSLHKGQGNRDETGGKAWPQFLVFGFKLIMPRHLNDFQ
jgi:hypothetical protein